MEPRSAERGNRSRRLKADPLRAASMEPRSAERGNQTVHCVNYRVSRASMEPRSAERGNTGCGEPQGIEKRRGFNGATLSRTWKPCGLALIATAQPMLQWSHAQPNVETSNEGDIAVMRADASMEPRSAERGNLSHHFRLEISSNGFNGATLSRTWKHTHGIRAGRGRSFRACFNGATLSRTWKPG